jgi:hypothetical protein
LRPPVERSRFNSPIFSSLFKTVHNWRTDSRALAVKTFSEGHATPLLLAKSAIASNASKPPPLADDDSQTRAITFTLNAEYPHGKIEEHPKSSFHLHRCQRSGRFSSPPIISTIARTGIAGGVCDFGSTIVLIRTVHILSLARRFAKIVRALFCLLRACTQNC